MISNHPFGNCLWSSCSSIFQYLSFNEDICNEQVARTCSTCGSSRVRHVHVTSVIITKSLSNSLARMRGCARLSLGLIRLKSNLVAAGLIFSGSREL